MEFCFGEIDKIGNELDIHELEAVTGGNAGILDWLPDALENKITTVSKPEFKQ